MCNVMTGARIRRLFTTRRALNIVPPPFPSFWTRPKVQWAAYSSDHCQTHDFRFARPFKINHRKFKAKPKVQTAKCVAINIIYQACPSKVFGAFTKVQQSYCKAYDRNLKSWFFFWPPSSKLDHWL